MTEELITEARRWPSPRWTNPIALLLRLADALEAVTAERDSARWAAGLLGDVSKESLASLQDAQAERDRLKAAIERAKAFLTDARETSEMRNRNAYGALNEGNTDDQG